jgi:hypothetical protein
MEWGEPVWSDAVPSDLPPPAVDWRKSIPREFVARTSPAGRPQHEPVRPEAPLSPPMANGSSYPLTGPDSGPSSGANPAWPAEHEDDAPEPAARHAVGGGRDEPSRANGVNGNTHAREAATSEAEAPAPAPAPAPTPTTGDAPATASEHDDELRLTADDTGPWNELDREIARALATALAGKLAQYVTGPILPLVADELARMVGTGGSPAEGGGSHGPEGRPRHFGEGKPRL